MWKLAFQPNQLVWELNQIAVAQTPPLNAPTFSLNILSALQKLYMLTYICGAV
jgi:hypothetical protein